MWELRGQRSNINLLALRIVIGSIRFPVVRAKILEKALCPRMFTSASFLPLVPSSFTRFPRKQFCHVSSSSLFLPCHSWFTLRSYFDLNVDVENICIHAFTMRWHELLHIRIYTHVYGKRNSLELRNLKGRQFARGFPFSITVNYERRALG